ncbi:beta-N-acetylhexosaminidase [Psychromonas sp. Urea-02u-13]|uniref:beta-N-acetylhexosaminidase n=1 Tax=Psychromonas sp. Urea-02u-13 TaxID=2058326 RepID=UPI000C33CC38|nr:family 20 glycosylhydrolase [Psychromonas sp. Urea-02u-13]PKG40487.1 beta-N-acetylhexosaminidase [Psychromonas sp. Urea-02u-13]
MKIKPLALLTLSLSGFASLGAFAAAPNTDLNLMPYPQEVVLNQGVLKVDANFSIALTGFQSPRLQATAQRLAERIELQTGLFLKQPMTRDSKTASLIINVKEGPASTYPQVKEDESYSLIVKNQQAMITANSPYGAIHAIETLLQLVTNDNQGASIPALTIKDEPRFKWRGVLLDTARHWVEIDTIKRQLDGIASAKLNVFHWHLTDDQAWRVEVKSYPKLTDVASDGKFYSQEEIKEVVAYATNLGIRVIPEIDVPGHASAIAVAYPELMSAPGPYQEEINWGVHKPLLDPSNADVYTFVDKVVAEMAALFPDEYLHIGGDEVDPTQWNESKKIKQYMEKNSLADDKALHAFFNQKVETILAKHDRKMIGWDEVYHPDLPKSIVIQSWQGQDALGDAVKDGFQGILSTGFYVDQPMDTSFHYRNEILPQPLTVDDQLHKGETFETWSFDMPRKRGSNVQGSFTLITDVKGVQRGFIDFKGKARRGVQDIQLEKGVTSFWLDTWMGHTSPRFETQGNKLTGYTRAGNGQYVMTGEKIASSAQKGTAIPDNRKPNSVPSEQADRILGGEITLWAENIKDDLVDLRLWPRSYAIAERLWSDVSLTDETSMYKRLDAMDNWSTVSVGLQQQWQEHKGFLRLSNGQDVRPLQVLAQAVEQAQYYHRHHEKSAAGNYHKFEPLNRFADALPVESNQARRLKLLVDTWTEDKSNTEAKVEMQTMFKLWVDNTPAALKLVDANYLLTEIKPVVESTDKIAKLGLELIDYIESGKTYPAAKVKQAKQIIFAAQQFQDELVVRAAYPVEKLLNAAY